VAQSQLESGAAKMEIKNAQESGRKKSQECEAPGPASDAEVQVVQVASTNCLMSIERLGIL
jgi:hypothetical protein